MHSQPLLNLQHLLLAKSTLRLSFGEVVDYVSINLFCKQIIHHNQFQRALAAERRLVNQSGAVISRCFLCAADITGKVPFQYLENNFCSVTCVKAHRMQNPTILS